MKYLVNSREMRFYDNYTSEVFKVPPLLLMEQAALAAVEEIEKVAKRDKAILIVCGTGNNGGDGLAVGRILKLKGYDIELVLIGDLLKATESNKKQQEILCAYHIPVRQELPEGKKYDVVVDAVFGVGLTREVEGIYKTTIEQMNDLNAYKIALDIPSGISADNGAILGTGFCADLTITFAFDKVGLYLWPGNEFVGRICVKKIGITERSFSEHTPAVRAVEEKDLECLVGRPSHSNKGTFGKVLVIAGSVNMAGAAILAGKSAYATGCGLVRILTPEENRMIIQTALPEAILTTYSSEMADMDVVKDAIEWANVILCGPGIGTNETAAHILKQVLNCASVPVILDADALNLVAKDVDILLSPHAEMVVTPHLGEMSRLTGKTVSYLQTNLLESAKEFADKYHVTCVLKDACTVTATSYGVLYLNLSGNAGMATAGSGDVLAGIIASLTAQGCNCDIAAYLGVYLHGLAGDKMIAYTGKNGLVASDLIEGIRKVFACNESRDDIL